MKSLLSATGRFSAAARPSDAITKARKLHARDCGSSLDRLIAEHPGELLATLSFETVDGEPAGEVHDVGPAELFDGTSLYTTFVDGPMDVTSVVPEGQLESPYSTVAQADLGGEENADIAAVPAALRWVVEGADGPTYVYAYFPQVDQAAHLSGTESEEYHGALEDVLRAIAAGLIEDLGPDTAEETLLILTADHGAVDTPGETGNVDMRADRFDKL